MYRKPKSIVKQVVIIALICGIFTQSIGKLVLLSNYLINKEFIIFNYCENKINPKLQCNGKCNLTKQLKEQTGLQGKLNESDYTRRLNELWRRFLIVGCGEVDDGAFPSLAIGATQHFFEDEWRAFQNISTQSALDKFAEKLGETSLFYKYLLKECAKKRAENFNDHLNAPF